MASWRFARPFAIALIAVAVTGCSAFAPPPPDARAVSAAAAALQGRWVDSLAPNRRLEFTPRDGRVEWQFDGFSSDAASIVRAGGTVSSDGDAFQLVGPIVSGPTGATGQIITIVLRREGDRLRGTLLGSRSIPIVVDFVRAP
jgi:hypothetical protein